MKIARIAAISLLACLPLAAAADMYTWRDPQTGRTRMSNSPPQWLRDGQPGPRVEVIRGNQVIDPAKAFATPQAPAQMSERQRAMARPSVDSQFREALAAAAKAAGAAGEAEGD